MRITTTLILLFLSIVCFGQLKGKVVSIADGDTFTILVDGNKQVKIRLHGIDCPEKKQAYGNVAKEFTSAQVFGKVVSVDVTDTDRYHRVIGVVRLPNEESLNDLLLEEGFAWHYIKYSDSPWYTLLEMKARKAGKGLWADKKAIAPWDFRRLR